MSDPALAVEKYRALEARRREYAQRSWISALVLIPAAFASLAGLTRISCPAPMDFVILGGTSAGMLSMLAALTAHFRREQNEAATQIAEQEGATPPPAPQARYSHGLTAAALALLLLYIAAWTLRPPCEADHLMEDPELTRRS